MSTGADIHVDDLAATPSAATQGWLARKEGPASKTSTIALFGNFGSNNFGNEGSLLAMVEFLRRERPEAQLFCICTDPSTVRNSLGMPAIPIRRSGRFGELSHRVVRIPLKVLGRVRNLAKAFLDIRRADVMIIPGTGILDDFGEPPHGMPLDILMWCFAARMSGTKVAFASIGAGPIGHPVSRWLMVSAAKLAHYRSYRDTRSKEFMRNAGLNVENDAVYPDVVFKLPTPKPASSAESTSVTSRTGVLTVGLGVMKYDGWYGFAHDGGAIFDLYLDKLARFVTHLLERGHRVKLLTGETTDMEAVDALLARLRVVAAGSVTERVSTGLVSSLHDLMEEISETDIVIATRFHNIVCALKMEKPVISLGYSAKNDVLLAEMGLDEYCQHVDTFDVEVLIAQFEKSIIETQKIKNAIHAGNLAFMEQLDLQDKRLLSEIFP